MATQYLESLVYKLLSKTLSDDEKRALSSWYDLTEHIDEESREDMKDALFHYVLDNISAHRVIQQLTENLEEDEENRDGDEDAEESGW
jgi:hypothetical protein